MASQILFNKGEQALLDAFLGGQSNYQGSAPGGQKIVPSVAGNWGLGMGTAQISSGGLTKTSGISAITEIGSVTPAGYGRATISRDQTGTGWPAATLVSGSYQTTGPQKTFTFSGTPSPNGAKCWFVAGSATIGDDNAIFGADTASERTFANGDMERITPTFRAS